MGASPQSQRHIMMVKFEYNYLRFFIYKIQTTKAGDGVLNKSLVGSMTEVPIIYNIMAIMGSLHERKCKLHDY